MMNISSCTIGDRFLVVAKNAAQLSAHYPGGSRTITVECTGSGTAPEDFVVINEWMASNSGRVLDPADQGADDWFELYNPGNEYADLSGFGVADDPSLPAKYIIPEGVGIEPLGFRLVWADEESSQTFTNGDLHVNFKLSASGGRCWGRSWWMLKWASQPWCGLLFPARPIACSIKMI